MFQTVQRPGVYSAAYDTVHYKEPIKSFEIKVGHSSAFGFPFVKRYSFCKAIFTHSLTHYIVNIFKVIGAHNKLLLL